MGLDFYCANCGAPMYPNVSTDHNYRGRIVIEPCEKCLEAARGEGYEDGRKDE